MKNYLYIVFSLLLFPILASSQNEQIIYQTKQKSILEYIANDLTRGRATGTLSNQMVSEFIKDKFENYGILPYNRGYYYQHFDVSGIRGRNIVGYLPSKNVSDKYIIVSAHYDHLGALNGFVYNGADDNASGVTALLNIAELCGVAHKAGKGLEYNIIFVAFDAKELSMAGSKHFVENMNIPTNKVIAAINIDQIGSILEPVTEGNKEYVVALGEKTLPKKNRGKIAHCNKYKNLNLEIDYTFYGSDAFTDIIYKLSDQNSFANKGIPALYFTSGFHKHTYKITDDINLIDYDVLRKRTLLIYYLIQTLT